MIRLGEGAGYVTRRIATGSGAQLRGLIQVCTNLCTNFDAMLYALATFEVPCSDFSSIARHRAHVPSCSSIV